MLNWLYPEVFVEETNIHFKEAFHLGDGKVNAIFIGCVKKFLECIMIRRVKESMMAELRLPQKYEINLYLPLTEIQKRLYLDTLTGGTESGGYEVNQHAGHTFVTPPQSPGFENHSLQPATMAHRSSMTNILMELRKVNRIWTHLAFFWIPKTNLESDLYTSLLHG